MTPVEQDIATLNAQAESVDALVVKALTTSDLLTDADRVEFERAEESIVESRREAEMTADSLRLC